MESIYKYLQPKYVSKFECDGKKCPANCCCRDWQIIVDDETYEKYSAVESSEKELTKNLSANEEGEGFLINHVDGKCPFMTEECLCKIQLEHGEEYLSQTCLSYPRQLVNFGEIVERSLTPTCPLAADLILNSEKIKFEFQPVELPKWAKGKLVVGETKVPQEFFSYILEIQTTSISILQERRLTTDQRLIVLGFYLFQVEEMQFFSEQIPILLQSVNFQILEFAEIFFGLLKNIYGNEKILKTAGNQKYIEFLNRAMSFNPVDELNIQELAENYFDLGEIRKIFLKEYEIFFENYLVNDFFGGVYPFKVDGTIQNNFAVFVATFKILESIALSMTAESRTNEKKLHEEIFEMICNISMDLNHNENYLAAVADFLKNKSDIRFFMRSLLQSK